MIRLIFINREYWKKRSWEVTDLNINAVAFFNTAFDDIEE